MKIVCIGGAPGGLCFAFLMKKGDAAHDIAIVERDNQTLAAREKAAQAAGPGELGTRLMRARLPA